MMITDDDWYRINYRALYRAHNDTLVAIARSEFGMTQADAEALAHECLLSLLSCLDRITDRRTWLIAALRCAGRDEKKARAQRALDKKNAAGLGEEWVM
jgi:DNA-directed RNA polymerase specialized sigma24 family protein